MKKRFGCPIFTGPEPQTSRCVAEDRRLVGAPSVKRNCSCAKLVAGRCCRALTLLWGGEALVSLEVFVARNGQQSKDKSAKTWNGNNSLVPILLVDFDVTAAV